MSFSNVSALVFSNVSDERLGNLTLLRSSGSLPFGARYRLIDFALSNLVNAGISSVGVVAKKNYMSLMEHIGSGVYWDLDRKHGGIKILPPFNNASVLKYAGFSDALNGAKNFITRSRAEYVVICEANVAANIELENALKLHIGNSADITFLWHKGKVPSNYSDTLVFNLEKGKDVISIDFCRSADSQQSYGIGYYIMNTDVLMDIIKLAHKNRLSDLKFAFFDDSVKRLKLFAFEHKGYISIIDDEKSYFKSNMDLLNPEIRKNIFNTKRPIFTKTRDDMPTRYGPYAEVQNCVIADGCVVEGCVKNSILFRGVKVEKGAVVENSIVMQSGIISTGDVVKSSIVDKNKFSSLKG